MLRHLGAACYDSRHGRASRADVARARGHRPQQDQPAGAGQRERV